MKASGRGCLKTILALIFLPMLVGGVLWLLPNLARVANHETVEGVVIELIRSVDSDGDTTYAPVYEYEVDGRLYRYQSKVSFGGMLVPRIGDTKTLLYNPDDPSDARVNNMFLLLVLPGLMVAISALAYVLLFMTWARGAWTRQREPDWSRSTKDQEPAWVLAEINDNRVPTTATFMGTEASPMDAEGRVRYRIRAQAELNGRMHKFESDWLDDDPTLVLMQRGNQVQVLIDPSDPDTYEVIFTR